MEEEWQEEGEKDKGRRGRRSRRRRRGGGEGGGGGVATAVAVMTRKQRCILAQFRSGTLPLKMKLGDGKKLPIPERVCLVCAEDAVEDEFNFICSKKI